MSRLAKLANVSKSTLSYWESGARTPSISELESVLHVLGVSEGLKSEVVRMIEAPRAVRKLRELLEGESPVTGDLLRALRFRRGWSQERLATEMGVRQSTIAKWEIGDAWPQREALHTLCFLLKASPEELHVLTSGRMMLHSEEKQDVSPEQLGMRFWQAIYDRNSELKDLSFLSLESDLWATSKRSEWAKPMLAEVYARHAQYLAEYERYVEARSTAKTAIEVGTAEEIEPDMLVPAVVADSRSMISLSAANAGRALDQVRQWVSICKRPEYNTWLLSEIGHYMSMSGRKQEALGLTALACERVQECENASDLVYRRIDHAKVLLHFGEPERAFEFLPQFESPSHAIKFEDAHLHGRVAAASSDHAAAAGWLARMNEISSQTVNERHQRMAHEFAAIL